MNSDKDNELTVSEGDRSLQCRRSRDTVPVPAPSLSDYGLPEMCSAGMTGELMAARMASQRSIDEAEDGLVPEKEKEDRVPSDGGMSRRSSVDSLGVADAREDTSPEKEDGATGDDDDAVTMSSAGPLKETTVEAGLVPEKEKDDMRANEVEIDGDIYVSSLEDPPTPISVARHGSSGRSEVVPCRVDLRRCDLDLAVPGVSDERKVAISS